ncbi:NACHT, LRR and PYD domains-containing protein 3-like isoform X2 [Oryzias latipes]
MGPELLLNTLEDLTEEDFLKFKWFLQQPHSLQGLPAIKKVHLQTAGRWEAVDVMVHTYGLPAAVEVTMKVLEKISRNDLLQSLSVSNSEGVTHAGELPEKDGSSAAGVSGLMVPAPEPRPITFYQKMLQSNLQDTFMCVQEGWAEDKRRLVDIYTELYVTAGRHVHIIAQHEVRHIEDAPKTTQTEKQVRPGEMFQHPSGDSRPIRTVLTNGIAGIGKSFLVQKFVLDWAEQRSNQDVHLLFPFSFRQLNPLKGQTFSLAELVHECIPESADIPADALNSIFAALQSSGNSNYDKSRFRILFVFDGLDESRLHLDLHCDSIRSVDVRKSTTTDVLLRTLIGGKLLRSARIWITTRPAAAGLIPPRLVCCTTEIRGFSDPQKDEFLRKRFREEEQANRVMAHIRKSRSLHIMCHIPVFCWITATVLEDLLKDVKDQNLPKTLTEMYTEFLMFQIDRAAEKYGPEKSLQYIKSLAKLAFQQLEKGNLIFYEKDLRDGGSDFREASVCSGVFTEIFREESGRKERNKMFSFVHLSVQEFLAAVYVRMSITNRSRSLSAGQLTLTNIQLLLSQKPCVKLHKIFINKAVESPNGHLDLFLRFLLGLSLQTNQDRLKTLLMRTTSNVGTDQETVRYIKKKISENLSAERSINLFHCLNELNDSSLVEEIQQFLSSGALSTDQLSSAQWSALVFILLSSEEDLKEFDLKKYSASEEALLRLLPVVKASSKAVLSSCNLSQRTCEALTSVLSSRTSLRDLDLSNNNIQDSGLNLLSAGLESPHCRLETVRLNQTGLTDKCCLIISSLMSKSSKLRHLDLGNNDLQDSGLKLLSGGLASPLCRLQSLGLSGCMITDTGCALLATAVKSNPSHLRELDLTYNHPGEAGMKLLLTELQDPLSRLECLRMEHGGELRLQPGLRKYFCGLTLDSNTAHKQLRLTPDLKTVTASRERHPYADHPERFHFCQVLCAPPLSGRSYWEVEWQQVVHVAVTYRGISRRGTRQECLFGRNQHSWSLCCSGIGYSVLHQNRSRFSALRPPQAPTE